MRRTRTIVSCLMILLICLLTAANVHAFDSECARVAQNFLRYLGSDKEILSIRTIETNVLDPALASVPVACLVNLKGGGYILIATSRSLTPVKAYSLRSDFGTLPPAVRTFFINEMEYNTRALLEGRRAASAEGKTEARWDFLLSLDNGRMPLEYVPDTRLLTTTWDQDYPYNRFLPEEGGELVVAGCVNVAMAQIIRYHSWPLEGTGVAYHDWNGEELEAIFSRAYHWDNMPDSLSSTTPEYMTDEVALLMRDLGIMNGTDFGCDDSSASPDMEKLAEHFGYSTGVAGMRRSDAGVDDTLFFGTLKGEIDNERPLLLEFPGHMTVADGYADDQTGEKIHVNMGWGGHSDDFYYLDDATVMAPPYVFPTDTLGIWYNIRPCGGSDCYQNLEAEDDESGLTIEGKFDAEKDTDRYDVYLKGNVTLGGDRGYGNVAFFVSVINKIDRTIYLTLTGGEPSGHDIVNGTLPAGLYEVKVSLCGETSCWNQGAGVNQYYTVWLTSEALTEAEKEAIDGALDYPPQINNECKDISLDVNGGSPFKIRVDARDKNGDPVTLGMTNTNPSAVAASLTGNILSLTPSAGQEGRATRITLTASSGGESVSKSFVVMVTEGRVYFGKEFVIGDIFTDQDDYNTHKVVLEGDCTISGDNGYSNQAFYSSVTETDGTPVVAPGAVDIHRVFSRNLYLLGASLEENPGGAGSFYNYVAGESDRYWLFISAPAADDSTEAVAELLGVDLGGTETLASAIVVFKIICGFAASTGEIAGIADVNGDGKIGLIEALNIVQVMAGLR